MKQHQFEAKHQSLWRRFDQLLVVNQKISKKEKAKQTEIAGEHVSVTQDSSDSNNKMMANKPSTHLTESDSAGYEFVDLYRVTCQHYALAKQRHYSPQLVNYLNDLVVKGHQQLYRHQSHIWSNIYHFFRYTFPIRLRRNSGLLWLSIICSLVPALLMGWACYEQSDMIYSLMPDSQVRMMEEMYNPANDMIGRESERRSDTDLMMFGYYIQNNISIDFRTYGSGIFAGIGTLFILLYNGLLLGGVGGHLTNVGFGSTFWPFVAGHSSFELIAMVISGVAGLRLAQALFMPGNYTRLDAFKIAGKQSIELLIGAAVMTFIAAFIEAFWSSSSAIPNMVKYIVGVLLWILVIGYLAFAGRRYEREIMGIGAYISQNTASPQSTAKSAKTADSSNTISSPSGVRPQQVTKS